MYLNGFLDYIKHSIMKRIMTIIMVGALTLGLSSCYRQGHNVTPNTPRLVAYQYVDEFNNNSGNWAFADGDNLAYGVISNGTFKFDYNDDRSQAYYISKDIIFNMDEDFEVETKIGSDNNFGLLIGYNSATGSYGYSFTVDYDGRFALYDEGGNGYGGDITEIVTPTYSGAVNANGGWNTVKIAQVGSRWIGYVNGREVFRVPAQALSAGSVGFVAIPFTRGEADYIQADWYEYE